MNSLNILDGIDQDRRRFFGAAAMAVAATQLGLIGSGSSTAAASTPEEPGRTPLSGR